MSLIDVDGLDVHYGDLQVLWDLSMEVREDDSVVSIVGPNGAGKTTLLKTLSGIVEPSNGRVEVLGQDVTKVPASDIVESGFVQVSEERNLFGDLTVEANLRMGSYTRRETFESNRDEVFEMFPVLADRRDKKARTLSGGEQQMLAIGRGLMSDPDLLLLDEASLGLAPVLVDDVFEAIQRINDEGTTVLLVEQDIYNALRVADRGYVIKTGEITLSGTAEELAQDERVEESYLGA